MPLFDLMQEECDDLMQEECDPVLHTVRLTNCAEEAPALPCTICRCRSFGLQVRAWNPAASLYRAAR
jgi:hypothetical protein